MSATAGNKVEGTSASWFANPRRGLDRPGNWDGIGGVGAIRQALPGGSAYRGGGSRTPNVRHAHKHLGRAEEAPSTADPALIREPGARPGGRLVDRLRPDLLWNAWCPVPSEDRTFEKEPQEILALSAAELCERLRGLGFVCYHAEIEEAFHAVSTEESPSACSTPRLSYSQFLAALQGDAAGARATKQPPFSEQCRAAYDAGSVEDAMAGVRAPWMAGCDGAR